jgi:hypothetical protein
LPLASRRVAVAWTDYPTSKVEPGKLTMTVAMGAGGGAFTTTVTLAVLVPLAFVAVSVYAVVTAGLTVIAVPVTAPGRGAMETDVAPETVPASVGDASGVMVEGVAVNETMNGVPVRDGPIPPGSAPPEEPQARIDVTAASASAVRRFRILKQPPGSTERLEAGGSLSLSSPPPVAG